MVSLVNGFLGNVMCKLVHAVTSDLDCHTVFAVNVHVTKI